LPGLHELGGIGVLRNPPAVLNQHLKNEIFFFAKAHLERVSSIVESFERGEGWREHSTTRCGTLISMASPTNKSYTCCLG